QRARRALPVPGAQPGRQTAPRRSQLIRYHAAWVLPIAAPPVRDGWVAVDDGRIVAVGGAQEDPADAGSDGDDRRASHRDDRGIRRQPDSDEDLGNVAILPG